MSAQLTLKDLNLTNFATFSNQRIKFDNNFNAIIGETGSGKSLILEALQLILGARADRKTVRNGFDYAIVEASFSSDSKSIKAYMDELGYPFDNDEIVIKRIIYNNGKTKNYINYQSCTMSTIVKFTSNFIDLVGQFDNQKLLNGQYQLKLLDSYAGLGEVLSDYNTTFSKIKEIKAELEIEIKRSQEIAQRSDYLDFQINELETLSPSVEDEEDLISKKKEYLDLQNNQSLFEEIECMFSGDENHAGLNTLLKKLDVNFSKILSPSQMDDFYSSQATLQELYYSVSKSLSVEVEQEDFEFILERLDQYQKTKRKFNTDTNGLIRLLEEFTLEKDDMNNINQTIDILSSKLDELISNATNLAEKLHEKRRLLSHKLAANLTSLIQELNMQGAELKINVEKLDGLNSDGFSKVEFMVQTNKGEGFHLLKNIASGGELSRVLLSVREILSNNDSISIFLFDEIDTGMGGETALKIGKHLSNLSNSSQVIAITHLPQIANNAKKLIVVSKELVSDNEEDRTISTIREISGLQLREEVALMTPLN